MRWIATKLPCSTSCWITNLRSWEMSNNYPSCQPRTQSPSNSKLRLRNVYNGSRWSSLSQNWRFLLPLLSRLEGNLMDRGIIQSTGLVCLASSINVSNSLSKTSVQRIGKAPLRGKLLSRNIILRGNWLSLSHDDVDFCILWIWGTCWRRFLMISLLGIIGISWHGSFRLRKNKIYSIVVVNWMLKQINEYCAMSTYI